MNVIPEQARPELLVQHPWCTKKEERRGAGRKGEREPFVSSQRDLLGVKSSVSNRETINTHCVSMTESPDLSCPLERTATFPLFHLSQDHFMFQACIYAATEFVFYSVALLGLYRMKYTSI